MAIRGPLLTVQQGNEGAFVRWLEELGLKEFLRRFPIPKLVEWGWLVPQYRHAFPQSAFEDDSQAPVVHFPPLPSDDPMEQLWESDWHIKDVNKPLWFLHSFFHPDDEAGKLLRNNGQPWNTIPIPSTFTKPNGVKVCPYVDYFFHWQGYALIDVIRASDCIEPILNTPDVKDRAQGIVRIAEHVKEWDPRDFLTSQGRWGGLAKSMTWLSHYRAFRDAIDGRSLGQKQEPGIKRRGAQELAAYLDLTPEKLSRVIKDDLLRLTQHWKSAQGRKEIWVGPAWTLLQQDLYFAVEWLCLLGDSKLDDHLEKWSRPIHRQYDGTAELIEVLPFEFFSNRYYFLDMAPHYLKPFNQFLSNKEKFADNHLKEVVDSLRSLNYPFGSFLSSFRQMHDDLTYKSSDIGKIDFRDRRPLDFYSLLAIRAEGCLMFALREAGDLAKINPDYRTLQRYIWHLAEKRKLSASAIKFFRSDTAKELVQLHAEPKTPIRGVMSCGTALAPRERLLVQAFLCCVLARNYFAHHHYLDQELLQSEESSFMLGGIITTVLFLIEAETHTSTTPPDKPVADMDKNTKDVLNKKTSGVKSTGAPKKNNGWIEKLFKGTFLVSLVVLIGLIATLVLAPVGTEVSMTKDSFSVRPIQIGNACKRLSRSKAEGLSPLSYCARCEIDIDWIDKRSKSEDQFECPKMRPNQSVRISVIGTIGITQLNGNSPTTKLWVDLRLKDPAISNDEGIRFGEANLPRFQPISNLSRTTTTSNEGDNYGTAKAILRLEKCVGTGDGGGELGCSSIGRTYVVIEEQSNGVRLK